MSDEEGHIRDFRAKQKRVIDKINSVCINALKEALANGEISAQEIMAAQQSLLNLEVGSVLAEQFHSELEAIDRSHADKFYNLLATLMKGLFVSGGLVITSSSLKRARLSSAHQKFQAVRDLHLEAIRYALTQPPSRPLGKARGTSAIADRALKSANQWLTNHGHEANLTKGKIQKRLERNPDDFPPTDSWQK